MRLILERGIYLFELALFQDLTSQDSLIPESEPSRLEVLKVSRVASIGSSSYFSEPFSS
jgi:hypothetical protein